MSEQDLKEIIRLLEAMNGKLDAIISELQYIGNMTGTH
jgi:hypothetical protein